MVNTILSLLLSVGSSMGLHGAVRATHYGEKFNGKLMANGRPYKSSNLIAASNAYPLGTLLKVSNPLTGIGIYVRVQDRTARTKHGHPVIDLSEKAFDLIGLRRKRGWGWVDIETVEDHTKYRTKRKATE